MKLLLVLPLRTCDSNGARGLSQMGEGTLEQQQCTREHRMAVMIKGGCANTRPGTQEVFNGQETVLSLPL